MIKLGLTGGMGTGKATVAMFFASLGALVVDADEIAREVVRPGCRAWKNLVEVFGKEILKADGSINRVALAGVVFREPEKLKRLNAIMHPPVIDEMRRRFRSAEEGGRYAVVVADVPLLFEAGLEAEFDKTVVVTCPREEQIRRCCARDGLSRDDVESRLRAQMPLEEKVSRSDYVISNRGLLEDTEKQVKNLWVKLRA